MATLIDPTVVKQLKASDIIFQPEISTRYIIESVGNGYVIASYFDLLGMSRKITFSELVEEKWQLKKL